MAKYRISLERWIQEALTDPDKDGTCVAISVAHIKASGSREEIHTTKTAGGATSKQLADLMRHKAETFAQDLPGVQTFRIGAYYGEEEEPGATYPLLINGITEHEGLATEGPTKDGMVAQMMRHNEALVQQNYQQTGRLFERMDRIVGSMASHFEALASSNQKLREESIEAWDFAKKLVLMQQTDEHEREMKTLEYARNTEERKKLMTMLPALANTVVGKEVFPQNSADSAILDTILEHVKPEQLQMAIQMLGLPNEVVAPLMTRALAYEEKRQKEEAEAIAARQLGAGTIDGGGDDNASHH